MGVILICDTIQALLLTLIAYNTIHRKKKEKKKRKERKKEKKKKRKKRLSARSIT